MTKLYAPVFWNKETDGSYVLICDETVVYKARRSNIYRSMGKFNVLGEQYKNVRDMKNAVHKSLGIKEDK